jgi:hypothetical protein
VLKIIKNRDGAGFACAAGQISGRGRLRGRLSGRPGASHAEIENFPVLYVFYENKLIFVKFLYIVYKIYMFQRTFNLRTLLGADFRPKLNRLLSIQFCKICTGLLSISMARSAYGLHI